MTIPWLLPPQYSCLSFRCALLKSVMFTVQFIVCAVLVWYLTEIHECEGCTYIYYTQTVYKFVSWCVKNASEWCKGANFGAWVFLLWWSGTLHHRLWTPWVPGGPRNTVLAILRIMSGKKCQIYLLSVNLHKDTFGLYLVNWATKVKT